MNYSNIFKRQTFMVVGAICIIMVVFIGISLALFTKNVEGKNLVVKSGNLQITFKQGNAISGELLPMSDTDGKSKGSLYSFDITNTGTVEANYSVQIYADTSVSGTHIPHQYVRVSYDGGTPVALSSLEKATTGAKESGNVYTFGKNNISVGTTNKQSHTIRIWIKEGAPTSIIGNTIALKIKVVSASGNKN